MMFLLAAALGAASIAFFGLRRHPPAISAASYHYRAMSVGCVASNLMVVWAIYFGVHG